MSEEEIIKLKAFISSETEKTKRGIRSAYILGVIGAIIIGGYMGFILHMEKTFLQPDNLAYLIRLEAESVIPTLIRQTESALVEQSRDGAQHLSDEFLTLIPQLTETGMRQIDLAYSEQIPYLSEEFSVIVAEYIHQHGTDLAAFAADHTSEEFAMYFTEAMMSELHKQLDARLAEEYEGRDLAYFKESITDAVTAMNITVDDLLVQSPESMTRSQTLQRRLLARLVASITDDNTTLGAGD